MIPPIPPHWHPQGSSLLSLDAAVHSLASDPRNPARLGFTLSSGACGAYDSGAARLTHLFSLPSGPQGPPGNARLSGSDPHREGGAGKQRLLKLTLPVIHLPAHS